DGGYVVLATYALASAAQATSDERLTPGSGPLATLLDRVKRGDINDDTYARSLRAATLSVHRRPQDLETLRDDASWLRWYAASGYCGYGRRREGDQWVDVRPGRRDQSNSQFALMGVWMAADAGVPIDPAFWTAAEAHWSRSQFPNGEWAYRAYTPAMASAGPARPRVPAAVAQPAAPARPQPAPRPTGPGGIDLDRFIHPTTRPAGPAAPEADSARAAPAAAPTDPHVYPTWTNRPMAGITPEVGGTLAMTCAGVASLVVATDYLYAARPPREFAPPHRALERGLACLEYGDNAISLAAQPRLGSLAMWGYDLFSVERVGLATGFKYLGDHDWYRELGTRVILAQRPDGWWGASQGRGTFLDTSFAVLFLARGRHPVMASKLRYEGAWNNRPRDLAGAARFVAKAVERPLNWQVVSLRKPGTDWLESPVLYVSGHEPPKLTDADYARVAEYVRWGGMVLLHADGGSASFRRWAAETFVPRVCPGRALADLPPGHPLRDVAYKLPAASVPLAAVTNGSRVLVVMSPDDHAGAWQARDEAGKASSFQLMANVFAYATGNVPPRNRLDTPF
ncbi:MAG TPA: DUF4159 domain-containing protein, partial [Humisphaera sp.]